MWSEIFNSLVAHDNAVFVIHLYLLGGDVLATWMVGAGILWESQKFETNHRVARKLILFGIVVETLCSVALFTVDEGISHAQEAKIIALSPRDFGEDEQSRLVADCGQYVGADKNAVVISQLDDSEGFRLGGEIISALNKLGLKTDDKRGEASVNIGTHPPLGFGVGAPASEWSLLSCVAGEFFLAHLLTQPPVKFPEQQPFTVVIGLKPIPE